MRLGASPHRRTTPALPILWGAASVSLWLTSDLGETEHTLEFTSATTGDGPLSAPPWHLPLPGRSPCLVFVLWARVPSQKPGEW